MPFSSWLMIKNTLRKSKFFCSKVVMIDILKDGVIIYWHFEYDNLFSKKQILIEKKTEKR